MYDWTFLTLSFFLNVSVSTGLPGQTGDGAKVSAEIYHLGLPSGVFVGGTKNLIIKKRRKNMIH